MPGATGPKGNDGTPGIDGTNGRDGRNGDRGPMVSLIQVYVCCNCIIAFHSYWYMAFVAYYLQPF